MSYCPRLPIWAERKANTFLSGKVSENATIFPHDIEKDKGLLLSVRHQEKLTTDLCLNSTEIHDANSKAISEMAYVPPYRPDIAVIPIALVDSTHFVGDIVKAFSPASFLNPSNSMGLKFGLYNSSHIPRNSMVLRFLIQFPIMPLGSSPFFCLAISVMQM